jgi:hypothetical protein
MKGNPIVLRSKGPYDVEQKFEAAIRMAGKQRKRKMPVAS